MVRKLESLASRMTDRELAASVLESANKIWLAGLGAFAVAQEEGTKAFDLLVKQGEGIQERARKAAGSKIAEVGEQASDAWNKIEHVFEGRVAKALHSLSVPSKKDIDGLSKRVAELTAVVNKLAGKGDRSAAAAARPKRARQAGAGRAHSAARVS